MQTQTRPKLTAPQREQLLDAGFLNLEGRYLTPTEQAWSWAEKTHAVTLSSSPVAAEVLEALLRRLVPFLASRRIGLAELLPLRAAAAPRLTTPTATKKAPPKAKAPPSKKVTRKAKAPSRKKVTLKKVAAPKKLGSLKKRADKVPAMLTERIESVCLALAHGKRKTRVMLSALRQQLGDVDRAELEQALLVLQDAERLVLYREDNSAALTDEDRRAALIINDEPRHLIMLEGNR